MKPYRQLWFDFDGVIADSLTHALGEINRLRVRFPTLPGAHSCEDLTDLFSVGLRESLQRFGLSSEESALFFHLHALAMEEHAVDIRPFPGVVEALAGNRSTHVLITSSRRASVDRVLSRAGFCVEDLFAAVYPHEVNLPKHQKMELALQEAGVDRSEVLYLGDLAHDVLAGRKAGIDVAAVGYGYHPLSYLMKFSPAHVVPTVGHFCDLLRYQAINNGRNDYGRAQESTVGYGLHQ